MTEPLLRVREVAEILRVHPSHVGRLVDREDLPARVLTTGPRGRRSLRFVAAEIQDWIDGRRERQVRATLDGERCRRRGAA